MRAAVNRGAAGSGAGLIAPLGVTRGPGGGVFATDFVNDGVFRWDADGAFVGLTDLSASVTDPGNIL